MRVLELLEHVGVNEATPALERPRETATAPRDELLVAAPDWGWRAVVKASMDRLGALLLLVFLLPVLVAVPLAIALDGRGPIFFRQLRYGLGGRRFRIWKFRTLTPQGTDESGAMQVAQGDLRVTRVGRFLRASSLDELPQLINVLVGDMSLVGPRPHPIGMLTEGCLGEEIDPEYLQRCRVKPGLTGLAQVAGLRGPTEKVEDLIARLELDRLYIETWSLRLDLEILWRTPGRLLANAP